MVAKEALQYKTRSDFCCNSVTAYNKAVKNGWLEDISTHMEDGRTPNGYWTKERCGKEANKYNTKSEFYRNSPAAYSAATENGWIDGLCDNMSAAKRRNRTCWTKESVQERALLYSGRYEFKRNDLQAWKYACDNDLMDEICSHMHSDRKPNGYWTEEKCLEVALKYDKRTDFKKGNYSAYSQAVRKGFLDTVCEHMQDNRREYTKEEITNIALGCKTKTQFQEVNFSAYNAAIRLGILDSVCSHMKDRGNRHIRCVYEIRNPLEKVVYVGLTYDIDKRNHESQPEINKLRESGEFIQVSPYIPAKQAALLEIELIEKYKNDTEWTCLNKNRGGHLGGPQKGYL